MLNLNLETDVRAGTPDTLLQYCLDGLLKSTEVYFKNVNFKCPPDPWRTQFHIKPVTVVIMIIIIISIVIVFVFQLGIFCITA
jgi:hypothetical protein